MTPKQVMTFSYLQAGDVMKEKFSVSQIMVSKWILWNKLFITSLPKS